MERHREGRGMPRREIVLSWDLSSLDFSCAYPSASNQQPRYLNYPITKHSRVAIILVNQTLYPILAHILFTSLTSHLMVTTCRIFHVAHSYTSWII